MSGGGQEPISLFQDVLGGGTPKAIGASRDQPDFGRNVFLEIDRRRPYAWSALHGQEARACSFQSSTRCPPEP